MDIAFEAWRNAHVHTELRNVATQPAYQSEWVRNPECAFQDWGCEQMCVWNLWPGLYYHILAVNLSWVVKTGTLFIRIPSVGWSISYSRKQTSFEEGKQICSLHDVFLHLHLFRFNTFGRFIIMAGLFWVTFCLKHKQLKNKIWWQFKDTRDFKWHEKQTICWPPVVAIPVLSGQLNSTQKIRLLLGTNR